MISLAGRDIAHSWGKFVFTGIGLGLLLGVTLTMAGVYRGMVDDGKALLDNSGADLWVVQKETLGPYAESSSLNDDVYRSLLAMPGIARAANVTYLTMQVRKDDRDVRAMVVGIAPGEPGTPGWPPYLVSGRQITRSHYEAVADVASGFKLGDRLHVRRNQYIVVGLTRRMVSSSGDPMVFIPLKDAQEAQFLKDNDAIWRSRRRTEANPAFNRPGASDLLDAVIASQSTNAFVNAVLVTVKPGYDPDEVAASIRRWKRFTAYTRPQMEGILAADLAAALSLHPGHRQRSHRCVHHLHADDGQDPRDRGLETDRHPQPHHCRHDHATGTRIGSDRFRGRQDHRDIHGAAIPQVRVARAA